MRAWKAAATAATAATATTAASLVDWGQLLPCSSCRCSSGSGGGGLSRPLNPSLRWLSELAQRTPTAQGVAPLLVSHCGTLTHGRLHIFRVQPALGLDRRKLLRMPALLLLLMMMMMMIRRQLLWLPRRRPLWRMRLHLRLMDGRRMA